MSRNNHKYGSGQSRGGGKTVRISHQKNYSQHTLRKDEEIITHLWPYGKLKRY